MSLTAETVLILIGALFLLIGLLGGGIEISAIKVPTAGAPQRAVLGLIGIVMLVVGGNYAVTSHSQEQATDDEVVQAASAASAADIAPSTADVAPSTTDTAASAASASTGEPPAPESEK